MAHLQHTFALWTQAHTRARVCELKVKKNDLAIFSPLYFASKYTKDFTTTTTKNPPTITS